MTTVTLAGYPEAVLGSSTIAVSLPSAPVAADAIHAVAAQRSQLAEALLHADRRPRRSTKVLIGGQVAANTTRIPAGAAITVLAALPCDG